MIAKNILNVGHGQRQIPTALGAQNQLCVRNSTNLNAVYHPLLDDRLSDYLCKPHNALFNPLLFRYIYNKTEPVTTKMAIN